MIRRRWMGVLLAAALSFTAGALRGQDASPADKEKALALLESSRKGVLDATKGLNEAQWNFKSAPDKWSVAECVEHIAAAEDLIRGMIADNVMKAPAAPDRDLAKTDAAVLNMVPSREKKVQAPEPLKPTNRYGSPEASLKHFEESRAATEAFLKTTPNLRGHAVDSPLGMKLDAYEWILYTAAHSERHTKQILEVKADANFPKK